MTALLSRYAESVFWLARYIERAENLARIIEVQETFTRDSKGANDWRAVLAINADIARFLEHYRVADARSVLDFYVLDRGNPTSLIANLFSARENARTLRPLIATEMWVQLNVFYNRVAALRPDDIVEERLARVCAMIKEGCDSHAGITAGTFYRDEAWSFYAIGAAIECADQTTRLLDVKFLSSEARASSDPAAVEPGSAVDASYWTALLRSAAGYQAFRRQHPRGMEPDQVAFFLLCDPRFPRSVACQVGIIDDHLQILRRIYRLRGVARALEHLDGIRDDLALDKVRVVVAKNGLHQFNDWLQRSFGDLTATLAETMFGHVPVDTPADPGVDGQEQDAGGSQKQVQSMSLTATPGG